MLALLKTARVQRWLRRAFFVAAAFAFVMALLPHPPSVPLVKGDKLQHMLAFFTLAGLAAAGWQRRGALSLFVALAIFGAAIELFQAIPALHRDADVMDWLADMAATLVGLGLARLVLLLIAQPVDDQG